MPHGHLGKHWGHSGCKGQETLLWYLWEGAVEAGQAGSVLAGLSNFSRLWGTELPLAVWYLAFY